MERLPSRAEVYERLSKGLDSALASAGMQRVSRVNWPCWVLKSPTAEERLYISLQVDEKATDPYAGGGFRIELEKSASQRPAAGLNGRAMFFQLLTAAELGNVLTAQNRVIRALPKPPPEQVAAYPAGRVREEYLSWFEAQERFDPIRTWLRYRTVADIDAWVRTLEPLVGAMVQRARDHLQRGKLHLGQGSLVETLS